MGANFAKGEYAQREHCPKWTLANYSHYYQSPFIPQGAFSFLIFEQIQILIKDIPISKQIQIPYNRAIGEVKYEF